MKLYIETERLLLREWTPNDLPTFIKMNQDPEVMEFFPKILDSKESINFYQRICKLYPLYRNRMETHKRCMESRLCNRSCQSMPSIWIY